MFGSTGRYHEVSLEELLTPAMHQEMPVARPTEQATGAQYAREGYDEDEDPFILSDEMRACLEQPRFGPSDNSDEQRFSADDRDALRAMSGLPPLLVAPAKKPSVPTTPPRQAKPAPSVPQPEARVSDSFVPQQEVHAVIGTNGNGRVEARFSAGDPEQLGRMMAFVLQPQVDESQAPLIDPTANAPSTYISHQLPQEAITELVPITERQSESYGSPSMDGQDILGYPSEDSDELAEPATDGAEQETADDPIETASDPNPRRRVITWRRVRMSGAVALLAASAAYGLPKYSTAYQDSHDKWYGKGASTLCSIGRLPLDPFTLKGFCETNNQEATK